MKCSLVPLVRTRSTAARQTGLPSSFFFEEELVQAHKLLVHDPPGADVLVPDLAVAHDPLGKADVQTAGPHQREGILCVEHVVAGLLSLDHGIELILFGMGILAPTIAYDENDGRTGVAHDRIHSCTIRTGEKGQSENRARQAV